MDSVTIKDNVTILEYSNQLINAFKNVDLVVTRGGATTLSELLACGTPSIVIPSPYVGNNEQLHNALELEAKNALVVLRESELTAESLYTKINELLFDDKKLKELSENASLNGIKDANDRIYDLIMEM
jgi:UDP-N-acetylglucosamine--N-acetylmuramyl-(pentapeptide) pyrophosphoryl-undecaprenol N-acetylglucosamine transferase